MTSSGGRHSAVCREAIGFIGLGQMGARMAPNLFRNADVTAVHIYDVNRDSVENVRKQIADVAKKQVVVHASPAAVARHCKNIVTMLPNGKIVREVFYCPRTGIFQTMLPGTMVIDSSTIDPETPKELCAVAATKGGSFIVDAPVSGGINAAAGATLTFMVGAENEENFKRANTLLNALGKNIFHCGKVGSGQVVKLCNNLILAQHMVAVSEAMLMGTKLGVDASTLAKVVNTSTGRCWTSEAYNPYPGVSPNVPSSRDYEGGFFSKLMLKDLGLAIDAAEGAGMTVKGANNAKAMYEEHCQAAEWASKDFSGIIKYIEGLKKLSAGGGGGHDDHGHGDHGHGGGEQGHGAGDHGHGGGAHH